jgi:anti-sigma B factor antagonist
MHLTTESLDGVPVARLTGELDKLALDQGAGTELDPLLGRGRLVVDLGGLTFIDSAGLHALFELAKRASSRSAAVAVCVPEASPVHRVVAVVRLGAVMPVLSTVEEAVAVVQVA